MMIRIMIVMFIIIILVSYVGERPTGTYAKPQQKREEESERLRGERDKIKFIALRLE